MRRSEATFATSLVVATPTDAVRPTSARIAALIARAIASGDPKSASEPATSRKASSIETCSISGVNRRRIAMTSPEARAVLRPVDRQEDAVRAERRGGPERHRGMDPEPARLVARGAHHAPGGRVAADDDGPAPELRPVALLDRREERVEVDVEDGGWAHEGP